MKLTFLVPGDTYSGGVRVTMQMGNCLKERGHAVRIAYPRTPLLSLKRVLSVARSMKYRCQGVSETRWLSCFKGKTETFLSLEELQFAEKEIVIATGIHTIEQLERLKVNVLKLRYCHGLLEHEPEERRKMWLWGGPMDTIAVSPVLVPELEKHCQGQILGVVPNGINPGEYFVENRHRDGVGLIFNGSPVKGPEVAEALIQAVHEWFPETPCYVFGSFPRPDALARCEYTRYPSIEKAREIYNRCKIWLVTSRDEGFCLPILEAMACGCAVISSKHSNALELIQDGVNGFTVPYGDVDAYVKLIARLIGDEPLRENICQEGLRSIKRFTWENAADRMEEALRRVNGIA